MFRGREEREEAARGIFLAPCMQVDAFLSVFLSLMPAFGVQAAFKSRDYPKRVNSTVVHWNLDFGHLSQSVIFTSLTDFWVCFVSSFYSGLL